MSKIVAVALTTLMLGAASVSFAQPAPQGTPGAGAGMGANPAMPGANELKEWGDRRLEIIKGALLLTPDQQKLWQPVEDAIRARAMARHERLVALANRPDGEFNPVQFLRNRADVLAARSAELKRLADAWQPLYQSLSPEQKQRLRIVVFYILRDMRDAIQFGPIQIEETEEF